MSEREKEFGVTHDYSTFSSSVWAVETLIGGCQLDIFQLPGGMIIL